MKEIKLYGYTWRVCGRLSELVEFIGQENFLQEIDCWWKVGDFSDGTMWMNNNSGIVVLHSGSRILFRSF